MKIAVTIATFRRHDNKTPAYLKRALDSVFAQKHSDFKVFLVGDEYDKPSELNSICSNYSSQKIEVFNLDKAVERRKYSHFPNRQILWCCAGVTAINFAIDKAVEEGINYICHLDHDDYWEVTHLQRINSQIERGADFVCTKSKYGLFGILPNGDFQEKVAYYLPQPGQIINSATCYNYQTIPFKYQNMYELCGQPIPSDADLWDRMKTHIQNNQLRSVLINRVTVFHEEEGYILYGGR